MKKHLLIILLIVVILEITLFNVNSYIVLNHNSIKVYKNKDFSYVENDEEFTYIEIENIGQEVKTVHVEFEWLEEARYQILYADETSSSLKEMPYKTYIKDLENSKYVPCYLSGESSKIAIKILSPEATVKEVTINEPIPFHISIKRMVVIYLISVFIYFLKTKEIFKVPYSEKIFTQELTLLVILFVFIITTYLIANYSTDGFNTTDFYSKDFVDALSNWQVHLQREPSDKLKELDNPYDGGERHSKGLIRDVDYMWDVAYYEGKYYVYFGILPALTVMLPYHMITGDYLSSAYAVMLFSVFTSISLMFLIKNVFKRFFADIPFKFMVFSFLIMLFGSQILWLNGIPRFYELAIISALFFAVTGIDFIFLCTEENCKYRYIKMFVGCLMLALAVACRPTQLLTSIIIVPVLIKLFIKNLKEKKDILKNIMAVAIPYLSVGIALMYYNYIRFGNIFEFGASYQITINDMSHLGNRFMTLGTGIICSLFSIPTFLPNFPFLQYHNNLLTFYGDYYVENMMGGLFIMVPICLFIFGIFKVWKRTDKKKTLYFIIDFIVVGIIFAIFSIMMGGSMQRYLADYAWIFIIAGICVFLEIVRLYKSEEAKNIMRKLFGVITIYVIIINLFSGIVSEKNYMSDNSPVKYNELKYTINFWE